MIKVGDKRFNMDEIWTYQPALVLDNPCIRVETRQGVEEDIIFKTEEERDKILDLLDSVLLMIKDGEIVQRDDVMDIPFIMGPGGMPSGGIPMQ